MLISPFLFDALNVVPVSYEFTIISLWLPVLDIIIFNSVQQGPFSQQPVGTKLDR